MSLTEDLYRLLDLTRDQETVGILRTGLSPSEISRERDALIKRLHAVLVDAPRVRSAVEVAVSDLASAGMDPQRQSRAADKVLGDLRRVLEA